MELLNNLLVSLKEKVHFISNLRNVELISMVLLIHILKNCPLLIQFVFLNVTLKTLEIFIFSSIETAVLTISWAATFTWLVFSFDLASFALFGIRMRFLLRFWSNVHIIIIVINLVQSFSLFIFSVNLIFLVHLLHLFNWCPPDLLLCRLLPYLSPGPLLWYHFWLRTFFRICLAEDTQLVLIWQILQSFEFDFFLFSPRLLHHLHKICLLILQPLVTATVKLLYFHPECFIQLLLVDPILFHQFHFTDAQRCHSQCLFVILILTSLLDHLIHEARRDVVRMVGIVRIWSISWLQQLQVIVIPEIVRILVNVRNVTSVRRIYVDWSIHRYWPPKVIQGEQLTIWRKELVSRTNMVEVLGTVTIDGDVAEFARYDEGIPWWVPLTINWLQIEIRMLHVKSSWIHDWKDAALKNVENDDSSCASTI